MSRRSKRRRAALLEMARERDGDTGDGGLALLDENGALIHVAVPPVTESLRYMVARLGLHQHGAIPQVLGLISAIQGEGVTFIARSLATVLANDSDSHVCLVDLNWWSPSPMPPLETERPGIADVVAGNAKLEQALAPTGHPRLKLISAGTTTVSQRPVLAKSPDLRETIDILRATYDYVLLDLPAVLATSEALTLAANCDSVAIVVRQGVTSESQVRTALGELSSIKTLGVIMNRMESSVPKAVLRRIPPW